MEHMLVRVTLVAGVLAFGVSFLSVTSLQRPQTLTAQVGGSNTVHCPLLPETNRRIIDFTLDGTLSAQELSLIANESDMQATLEWDSEPIEPGVYNITLASFDTHSEYPEGDSSKEQWHLELLDAGGATILTTHHIRDIDDTEDVVIEIVEAGVELPTVANRVVARHTAHPDSEPHSFTPLCAAFDLIAPQEEGPSTEGESDESVVGDIACPFKPHADRIVIDFTRGGTRSLAELAVSADTTVDNAQRRISTNTIPSGMYDISLASFDVHGVLIDNDSHEEQWVLELRADSGTTLLRSSYIRDIAQSEDLVIERVDADVILTKDASIGVARHHAYPDIESHTFVPVCAALDRTGSLETEEKVSEEVGVVPAEKSPELSTHVACPLTARDGRHVVDFTKRGTVPLGELMLEAHTTNEAAAVGPVSSYIPRGVYHVTYVSHGIPATEKQSTQQVWHMHLYDAEENEVVRTANSVNISNKFDIFSSILDTEIVLYEPVVRVAAVHGRYPADAAHAVVVLCAAFDREPSSDAVSNKDQLQLLGDDMYMAVGASVGPVDKVARNTLTFIILAVLLLAICVIVFLSMWVSRREDEAESVSNTLHKEKRS